MFPSLFAALPNVSPPEGDSAWYLYGGGGAVVLLLFVVVIFSRRGKAKHDPDAGLDEDLSKITPAGGGDDRNYQLFVMNHPVRLRLVVVAPVGKKPLAKPDSVLEQVYRHLGEVMLDDKPRVRVWPSQLSSAGFAPTFFRHVKRPEADGKASRWVLLAGPARAGGSPVLVGLAVQADEAVKIGSLTLGETQWAEVLRVETA
jgi:hypothetical protein